MTLDHPPYGGWGRGWLGISPERGRAARPCTGAPGARKRVPRCSPLARGWSSPCSPCSPPGTGRLRVAARGSGPGAARRPCQGLRAGAAGWGRDEGRPAIPRPPRRRRGSNKRRDKEAGPVTRASGVTRGVHARIRRGAGAAYGAGCRRRRRRANAKPANPAPNRAADAGSGTGRSCWPLTVTPSMARPVLNCVSEALVTPNAR